MTGSSLVRPLAVLTLLLVAACSGEPSGRAEPTPSAATTPPPISPAPRPSLEPGRMMADVRHLAEEIGPRHATSPAFVEAADWVQQRFEDLGYEVERREVDAPAGNTWGVDVAAGTSYNVIASPPGLDPTEPHRIVGAHLDTVPVAPGAEDNASGVATMLELARIHAGSPEPVRFIAFGAEEPRGPGDDLHHFGSQQYANALDPAERDAMRAMVALDRVGVPGAVPVCHGGRGPRDVRDALERAARAAEVPHEVCGDNRTSDHWSFERAGMAAARLGSLPYAGYHTADDVVSVVDERQLERVATIMLRWLEQG